MIYILIVDDIDDEHSMNKVKTHLEIMTSNKPLEDMIVLTPCGYDETFKKLLGTKLVSAFPEESNSISIMIKYSVQLIVEIMNLNPNMDKTLKILNHFTSFRQRYNSSVTPIENLLNIKRLTLDAIHQLSITEIRLYDPADMTIQDFTESEDYSELNFWKKALIENIEELFKAYKLEHKIKLLGQQLIEEACKETYNPLIQDISKTIKIQKDELSKYDKFKLCHSLLDLSYITCMYVFVHHYVELFNMQKSLNHVFVIGAVDYFVFAKLLSLEITRRRLSNVSYIVSGVTVETGHKVNVDEIYMNLRNKIKEIEKAQKEKEFRLAQEKAEMEAALLIKMENEKELKKISKKQREIEEKRKRLEAEAEKKRLEEAEAKAKAEAEKKRLEEAEAKALAEAEKKRLEAERKRKADEAKAKVEAEKKRLEAERKRLEFEAKAKAKAEAERKRKAEEAKVKAEAERKRLESEARAKAEAEAAKLIVNFIETYYNKKKSKVFIQNHYFNIETMPEFEYFYRDPTFYIKYPRCHIFYMFENHPWLFHPVDLNIYNHTKHLYTLYQNFMATPEDSEQRVALFNLYNVQLYNIWNLISNRNYENFL